MTTEIIADNQENAETTNLKRIPVEKKKTTLFLVFQEEKKKPDFAKLREFLTICLRCNLQQPSHVEFL